MRLSEREAVLIARGDPKVEGVQAERGRLEAAAQPKPPGTWQVGFFDGDEEVVQVLVDDPAGTIRESWTGYQVAWQMARGYEGQFGHVLNAPYVWIPLAAIFLVGLVEWRRPWRLAHLDLLVLLSFGVSQVLFNRGEIGLSVPLAYPPLLYLLARMLWVGFRGGHVGLRPSAPASALAIVALFLVGFRVAINVADSGVIDVGYAGVIGADRIAHAESLYGGKAFPEDNPTGDTYGPANYYAYLPFELALPWSGEWDGLPAAHAAALLFDLATLAGLLLLGRRLRPGRQGRDLGVVLCFAWLAYPYTAFALQSNANDSLIAALVAWSLALFASPLARGALLGLATLAKFAPLALVPLYAAGERGLGKRELRVAAPFAAAFLTVAALMLAHPAIDPGLAVFWDRTLGSQLDRDSPFSIWGQEPSLEWLRTALLGAAAGLAALVAFLPRRRTLPQMGALAAAALIAVQIPAEHWFYLYIPWFLPALLLALCPARAAGGDEPRGARGERAAPGAGEPGAGEAGHGARLIVDGMNVIGSRPDRWWEDRAGAMRALVAELERYAKRTGERIAAVFDGRPFPIPEAERVEVGFAPGGRNAADDEIVRMVEAAGDPERLTVVTSDKALAARVRELGAAVTPAGSFRRRLDRL